MANLNQIEVENVVYDIEDNAIRTANKVLITNAQGKMVASELGITDIGGIIVSSSTPAGNSSKLWIDTGHGGIAKYWNGSAWKTVKAVWG